MSRESFTMIMLALAGVAVLAIAIYLIIKYNRYVIHRNYIITEMNRSRSKKEYSHWERRLKKLKLRQIPIIGHFIGK